MKSKLCEAVQQMSRTRLLFPVLLFILGGILAGLFFWRGAEPNRSSDSPPPVPAGASEERAGTSVDSPATPLVERTTLDPDASVDYGALREALRPLESQGDAVALRMIAEIYEYCFIYSLDPAKARRQAEFLATLRPENASRLAEIAKLQDARCKTLDGGAPIVPELVGLYRDRARERGDRVSELADFEALQEANPEGAERLVESIVHAARPDELMALSQLAARRTLPGELSMLSGSERYGHAWAIAACRRAGSQTCGPSGRLMTQTCLAAGLCNYSSYEDLVRRGLTPPSSLHDLDRAISRVENRLKE